MASIETRLGRAFKDMQAVVEEHDADHTSRTGTSLDEIRDVAGSLWDLYLADTVEGDQDFARAAFVMGVGLGFKAGEDDDG